MQPDVFQAACLCRLKAVFKAALKEEWYVCGYVTIFLARPGALFKECYSIQNTFPVLSSVSCSQSLSQSVPESLAGQCLVSQGLMFSWQEGRSAAAGESQSENRYSCCGCLSTTSTALCLSLEVQGRLWLQESPSTWPLWSWTVASSPVPPCCAVSLAKRAAEQPACAARIPEEAQVKVGTGGAGCGVALSLSLQQGPDLPIAHTGGH